MLAHSVKKPIISGEESRNATQFSFFFFFLHLNITTKGFKNVFLFLEEKFSICLRMDFERMLVFVNYMLLGYLNKSKILSPKVTLQCF